MKKIAIITGASSGMGSDFARQISKMNVCDELWLIARRIEKLEELCKEIKQNECKKNIVPLKIDLKDRIDCNSFKNFLENESKKYSENEFQISVLVNNAGFGTYGPFEETPVEKELDMIDLNCTTLTFLCSIVIPYMKKDSLIINTSSLAAFMPLGNFAVYAATKAYVLNFSCALAAELKDKGIKVCALCPGSVSTEFALVASNGVREKVKNGRSSEKTVEHCLKKAFKGKKIILKYPKWKLFSFLSKFFGRYFIARMTYKFAKRPYKYD